MSDGRKTRPITFNIKDRGRIYTGVDRKNVNYEAWIQLINSPATQELVKTGSMLGYYGHQLRMLYGLQVPETVIVNGKQVSISPALRTIELSCDAEGNVTHRQEFLNTTEGDTALNYYRNNIGGFSSANDYKNVNGVIYPTVAFGFDYVLQPNYATNIGDSVLLDSLSGDLVRTNLEQSFFAMYDSIHKVAYANHNAEINLQRAIESENQLLAAQAEKEHRLELQKERDNKMLDSALCPTQDIDEYLNNAKLFLDSVVVETLEPKKEPMKKTVTENVTGWFSGLF